MAEPIRCAIYTRVSDDQGLDLSFNTLHAQYDAAEAYIRSQAHAGWVLLPDKYDDGGFTGGNTKRPALQNLIADIQAGKIDIVLVYKVDRLTRSLADFAKLVELFDKHDVSFASVTQPFNTTTSLGRLTLNVLLSFAQFEREISSERIRDKLAASKRKGLYVGGAIPFGYKLFNKSILVKEREARRVRLIFRKYIEMRTVTDVADYLNQQGLLTKVRGFRNGELFGGIRYSKDAVGRVLRNRSYVGQLIVRGEIVKAPHPPIVNTKVFNAVQMKLDRARQGRSWGLPKTPLA